MAGVIVHEWISQNGGSENVVQAMADIYPDADVVCLWNDSVGRFDPGRVRESWLARTPLRRSKVLALPFMPPTWRLMRDRNYDFALISTHLFAHHARFNVPVTRRFVYVHSPARYLWCPEIDPRGSGRLVRILGRPLQQVDRRRARETEIFAVNSDYVRRRMADVWGVDARTIHPPVDVAAIQEVDDWRSRLSADDLAQFDRLPADFILGASRFVPYKRLDQVVRAGELSGRPVVLAGDGPLWDELRDRATAARVPVALVRRPSTALLRALYGSCAAFVFPAIEDFGIMPVEAMAAGAAVVANVQGGVAESVVAGRTGALTDFGADADLAAAVEQAVGNRGESCRVRAVDFSVDRFEREIRDWMDPIPVRSAA